MPPKISAVTVRALQTLADQDVAGPMTDHRGEFAMDAVMNEAINAYAAHLGGRNARSKAIRALIAKGAAQVVAERS